VGWVSRHAKVQAAPSHAKCLSNLLSSTMLLVQGAGGVHVMFSACPRMLLLGRIGGAV
jgi:hypothetical protein